MVGRATFALMLIAVAALAPPPALAVKSLIGLRLSCNVGSTLSVAKTADPIYYEFSGDLSGKPYTVCNSAGGAWGGRHGSAAANLFERCETFVVALYALACAGGAVQGIPLSLAIREMRRATGLRGLTEAYPVQANAILIPVWGPERTVMVPLPAGHGIVEDLNAYRVDPVGIIWDDERGIPFVPVSGSVPASAPQIEPGRWWVALLWTVFPWGQFVLGVGIAFFAVVCHAGFSRGLGNPDEARKLRLIVIACIALLGVILSGLPGQMPEAAREEGMRQFERARSEAATVERDRGTLRSIIHVSNNVIAPLPQSDLERIKTLMQVHRIDPIQVAQPDPEFWAILCLLPIPVLFAFYLRRFVIGWDWFSRKHPAAAVVLPAVKQSAPVKADALADALTPDVRDLKLRKPSYQLKHDAEKARALKEKLDADAEVAEAAIRRELKRAELTRKKADVARLQRELGE